MQRGGCGARQPAPHGGPDPRDPRPPSPTHPQAGAEKPKRPVSAMFIFSEEKRRQLQEERPELSESELTRLLARMWNDLSEKKKVRAAWRPQAGTAVGGAGPGRVQSAPPYSPGPAPWLVRPLQVVCAQCPSCPAGQVQGPGSRPEGTVREEARHRTRRARQAARVAQASRRDLAAERHWRLPGALQGGQWW